MCCDPRLLDHTVAAKHSAKLDELIEIINEVTSEGRRMLIFSEFTTMLDLIEREIDARDIAHLRMDGSTPEKARSRMKTQFTEGLAPIFLLTTKTGGVGLTLTAADTLVLFDPWWNPAREQQAMARIDRIGQTKPTFMYRLLIKDSIEERILELQQRNDALAEALHSSGTTKTMNFTLEDVERLFS